MRNASGHQGENERQRKKKVNNRTTYDISSIKRVTRKFLEVSRCRRAKQRQRNVQKRCTASASSWQNLKQNSSAKAESSQ